MEHRGAVGAAAEVLRGTRVADVSLDQVDVRCDLAKPVQRSAGPDEGTDAIERQRGRIGGVVRMSGLEDAQ
jgi:hypothetical protein